MTGTTRLTARTLDGVMEIRLGSDGHIFLTGKLCEELESVLSDAAADADVRVVILTGANPGVFMRHFSVAEILEVSATLQAAGVKPGDAVPYNAAPIDRCMALIEAMEKPVIAAINGECMGGAMELSLACDLRIAEAGPYRLGQLETLLGILPGAGGTQRLARVIGPANTMAHVLTGLPILPEEAQRLGMVHEVAADALSAARAKATHFLRLPAPALAHVKRLVHASRHLPLEAGLQLERALFLDLALRPESIALMRAYEAGQFKFTLTETGWQVEMPEV